MAQLVKRELTSVGRHIGRQSTADLGIGDELTFERIRRRGATSSSQADTAQPPEQADFIEAREQPIG